MGSSLGRNGVLLHYESISSANERIVIIEPDDNALLLLMTALKRTRFPFRIVTARDLTEARANLEEGDRIPRLMIVPFNRPGYREFLHRLRASDQFRSMRVLRLRKVLEPDRCDCLARQISAAASL